MEGQRSLFFRALSYVSHTRDFSSFKLNEETLRQFAISDIKALQTKSEVTG
jgi:hypothetical protein